MTNVQFLITIAVMGLAVQLTRFTPFILFRKSDKLPPIVEYLGKVLPAAMMGLLVVYCFKDVNYADMSQVIPSLIAFAAIVCLHLWKHNTILSIALGTAIYMVLIRIM